MLTAHTHILKKRLISSDPRIAVFESGEYVLAIVMDVSPKMMLARRRHRTNCHQISSHVNLTQRHTYIKGLPRKKIMFGKKTLYPFTVKGLARKAVAKEKPPVTPL